MTCMLHYWESQWLHSWLLFPVGNFTNLIWATAKEIDSRQVFCLARETIRFDFLVRRIIEHLSETRSVRSRGCRSAIFWRASRPFSISWKNLNYDYCAFSIYFHFFVRHLNFPTRCQALVAQHFLARASAKRQRIFDFWLGYKPLVKSNHKLPQKINTCSSNSIKITLKWRQVLMIVLIKRETEKYVVPRVVVVNQAAVVLATSIYWRV